MTLIELIIFIINAACGFFVGRYFWNHFGFIYSPIGFALGFLASVGAFQLIVLAVKCWNRIFPRAKE